MSDVQAGFARTDDGQQLYYRTIGQGPPMVCCNGVGVSTFFWKYVAEHYRERFKVVLWDYRGHGLSAIPPNPGTADLTITRNARDLACVLDAVGAREPAVLLGHSMGCQVILEFTRQFPERARALALMFGTFARPLDTFMDFEHARTVFNLVHKVTKAGGRRGVRMLLPLYTSPLAYTLGRYSGLVDRFYAEESDISSYMEHLAEMNPEVFLRMVEQMADHDLTDFLPQVRVPALVIGGEKDMFTPLHRSRKMAELIPGAELMILAHGSHAAIVERPETINLRMDRFLAERVLPLSARPPQAEDAPAAEAS